MDEWLARLRHDLVKQVSWRARDLLDLGQAPRRADLLALRRGVLELRDEEGRPLSALALWQALRGEAGDRDAAALAAFEQAVARAQAAAMALDPDSVASGAALIDAALGVAAAFADLQRAAPRGSR